jgi:putative ABC transport system permease protein
MRTNLALLNILHSPPKTLLSVAGIGVAILLIFMQLGFRGAVENTATNIYSKLDFDILLRSVDYLHFVDSNRIDRKFLDDAAGIAGVDQVNCLNVTIANWRNPQGEMKGILLLGVDPSASPFRDRRVDHAFSALTSRNSLLIDRQAHPEFGPLNQKRFAETDVNRRFEVASHQMEIVGLFDLGAGLAANGAAIVSLKTFETLDPTSSSNRVAFGLIKLNEGESAEEIAQKLQSRYRLSPSETSIEVLTRDEVIQFELDRWLGETPIGFIFTLGVLISLVVGAAIVNMVLGNDVASRLHEYATLRAMGYSNIYLSTVVLRQALLLAVFSFVPALGLAFILYSLTGLLANLTMEMNLARIGFVLLLTLLMCVLAGTLSLKKLWQAEPADLF